MQKVPASVHTLAIKLGIPTSTIYIRISISIRFRSVKYVYQMITILICSGAGTGGARGATGPPNIWQIS